MDKAKDVASAENIMKGAAKMSEVKDKYMPDEKKEDWAISKASA